MSRCCWQVLKRLADNGNTVVVIEHNLEVIKTADWILDLGPKGGAAGGDLVAFGPPEKVARGKGLTAKHLRPALEREKELSTKAKASSTKLNRSSTKPSPSSTNPKPPSTKPNPSEPSSTKPFRKKAA